MSTMKSIRATTAWLALACVWLGGCTEADSNIASDPPALSVQQTRDALTIEAIVPRTGDFGDVIPGRVAFRPQALAAVSAPIQARVVAVHVSPGDTVNAGAPLMTLKGAEVAAAHASLDQANARAAAAEDLLKRQTEMMTKGVGLEVDRFAAETAAREARAELDRARRAVAQLGDSDGDQFTLRAPTSGVVTEVRGKIGATASPDGEALVDVGDPDQLFVIADIPESEIASIRTGLAAKVTIRSLDTTYDAVVEKVGRMIDADQRRVPIYIALRGAIKPLSPGMLADVRLYNTAEANLSLPVEAVLIKDGSRYVVYVEGNDGKIEPRPISIGVSRNGRVTVTGGLRSGEKVVVKGALLLDSGSEQLL